MAGAPTGTAGCSPGCKCTFRSPGPWDPAGRVGLEVRLGGSRTLTRLVGMGMAIPEGQAAPRLVQTGSLFPDCPGPEEELQPVPGGKKKNLSPCSVSVYLQVLFIRLAFSTGQQSAPLYPAHN